uniref:Ninjurin 1 n=1 Tax=Pavo cristatus TaxID=9049 RepID=A0A8C9F0Y8_PAVCR
MHLTHEELGTTGDTLPSQWFQRNGPMNINHYANKKSAAESMLDIALLMANASQLKAVIEQGPSFSFYMPLIVLISLSLTMQVMVGILLIFLGTYHPTVQSVKPQENRLTGNMLPCCRPVGKKKPVVGIHTHNSALITCTFNTTP